MALPDMYIASPAIIPFTGSIVVKGATATASLIACSLKLARYLI